MNINPTIIRLITKRRAKWPPINPAFTKASQHVGHYGGVAQAQQGEEAPTMVEVVEYIITPTSPTLKLDPKRQGGAQGASNNAVQPVISPYTSRLGFNAVLVASLLHRLSELTSYSFGFIAGLIWFLRKTIDAPLLSQYLQKAEVPTLFVFYSFFCAYLITEARYQIINLGLMKMTKTSMKASAVFVIIASVASCVASAILILY